jgi:predicted PurR-regulated permease PerM
LIGAGSSALLFPILPGLLSGLLDFIPNFGSILASVRWSNQADAGVQ